jgi:hypothetical protein
MTELTVVSSAKSIDMTTFTQSDRMVAPTSYLCDVNTLLYVGNVEALGRARISVWKRDR